MMNPELVESICKATNASSVAQWDSLQTLWSGYGQIYRVMLEDANVPSVIVKHVSPPKKANQPRGWNTDHSHQRKLHSYEVEACWYQDWSALVTNCRVAECYAVEATDHGIAFILEDLDASGFSGRWVSPSLPQIELGIRWLANFHVALLGKVPDGLWATGTYWHLETRPDELAAMNEADPLRKHASSIDQKLSQASFATIVHGDAKIANFCVANDGASVAAVDFQYVGGGCAMKDVVYFLGSCLTDTELEQYCITLLSSYFQECRFLWRDERSPDDFEEECRSLIPYAWADFQRFLVGWFPQHAKLTGYSDRMTRKAIASIEAA
ncbi:MAG: phosphotransferase [Rubripirellula sp.]